VETVSNHEFKASVLGAYERGERSISVRRLHRLATLYGVAVAQLIPGGAGTHEEEVVVDLTAAEEGVRSELIDRFITTIQLMRTDLRGEGSAIRQSDLRVLASLLKAESERADDDQR
jgi:transcriptional regulator with XRE-family HTH domain